jgi:ribosome-binding protein aMBF1 (putative translation factor)
VYKKTLHDSILNFKALSEPIKIPYNPAVLLWARERLGMSKNVAAESLNISVSTLESIEKGIIQATLDQ